MLLSVSVRVVANMWVTCRCLSIRRSATLGDNEGLSDRADEFECCLELADRVGVLSLYSRNASGSHGRRNSMSSSVCGQLDCSSCCADNKQRLERKANQKLDALVLLTCVVACEQKIQLTSASRVRPATAGLVLPASTSMAHSVFGRPSRWRSATECVCASFYSGAS